MEREIKLPVGGIIEGEQYATQKFDTVIRGRRQTHELWLPLDLTEQEAEELCAEIRKLVSK